MSLSPKSHGGEGDDVQSTCAMSSGAREFTQDAGTFSNYTPTASCIISYNLSYSLRKSTVDSVIGDEKACDFLLVSIGGVRECAGADRIIDFLFLAGLVDWSGLRTTKDWRT